jgi:hypothetical protein
MNGNTKSLSYYISVAVIAGITAIILSLIFPNLPMPLKGGISGGIGVMVVSLLWKYNRS